ncbi:MAG: SpaA isopeptide-forming pilin-related protein, partial [Acidimicrobiales bacterium]|nr:SpaA isopeptide-forming pilin-related protein [Acidimicrobiales bacterium]
PDDGLQGSSKENDPTGFSCQSKDGGITPGKDNLERAYIYPDITLSQGLLALGFVRAEGGTQGNAHVNFEFNQAPITLGADCQYLGRVAGDLLFVFDFPGNQGDPAEITVFEWDPAVSADGEWAELTLSDVAAFAVAADNLTDMTDEVIPGGVTVPQRAFGEVILDLVELDFQIQEGGGDGILTCPGFGTASVRSRSSGESFNSALQDFINPIPVDVSTCGDVSIKKVDDLGNPMQGVDFDLFDSDDVLVDECTTDAQGICTFDEVPPGDGYYVNEDASTVPDGYTAASNPVKSGISVGFKESVDLTLEPIVNPRQTGYVEVTKLLAEMDPDGGADTIVVPDDVSVLAGTTFLLYEDDVADGANGNGEYDAGEEVFLHGTTDPATCTIAAGDDRCSFGPVATGDYRVTETVAPPETSPGPDVPVTVTADNTAQLPAQVAFTNYLSPLEISLDKSGPAQATVGDIFTYTFDVTLAIDIPLTNIVLEELTPNRCNHSGLTGATKTGGDQDDWLEMGETWSYSCQHEVLPTDPDPLDNEAKVSGDDQFGRESSDTDTHLVDILYPDVTVEKVAVDDSITAGDAIAFDITVTNDGGGIARAVTLTDALPTGITWSEDSQDCSIAAGILTCDFGDLAAGASSDTVRVSGTTDTGDCGNVENTAMVASTNELDNATGNNSGTDDVDVSCPDVQITKSGNGTINAGDDAIFTLTVTNNDQEAAATDVTVSDTLPGDIVWTTTNTDCDISGAGVLSCDLGDLDPGESVQIIITGGTDPADCGTLPNTATVDASNEGPDGPDNNSDSATITVECPDLTIDKTPDDAVVDAGDDVSFTIVIGNDGPGTAYDVTVDDTLPSDVDWTIDPAVDGCAITSGVLECDLGDLGDGESVSITVTGTTDAADCGVLDNTASADASNDDEVSDDGDITVECPDIDITKVADDDVVSAGSDVGFTITVSNDGPGTAYDVSVDDDLPGGLDWSLDPVVDGCAIADGALSCDVGNLAADGEMAIHLTAPTDEDDCGTLTNEASADASNDDEVRADDDVAILCPGLNVGKTADESTVDAGDLVGYTITVSNVDDGVPPAEGTATDVTVTDPLPGGLEWSLDPAVDGCAISDGVLECDLGDLEPGDSVEIHVVATSGVADCGDLDNVAVADATNSPAVDDDASILVLCPLDIEIDKDGPTLAHVGDEITYTFSVTNSGEADLVAVEITDPLCDSEISLDDDADGDSVMAVGETWAYSCTHVVTDDDPDPLPNTATAVGTDEHDRETDDDDDHLVDVINPAIQIIKTVDNSAPNPGDTITFSYEVTNT